MSDTKFTPGPWVVENGGDIFGPLGGDSGDGIDCDGNDGWQVAEVGYYSAAVDGQLMEMGGGPRLANIALIKAAPDLYEALSRCKFDSLNMTFADLEFCKAAMAKARGEKS